MKFLSGLVVLLLATLAYGCRDMRPDCNNMRSYCSIPAYRKFMTDNCPRLCGFCGGPGPQTQRPPVTYPTGGPPSGECGKPSFAHSRVIAGTTARRGAWPWQILLKYNGRAGCGGSIVSPTWIVTAAHCVSGKSARSFTVRVGEHDRNRPEGSEVDIQASRVITHPGWSRSTMNNDIAMIKLSRPIQYNRYVQPVCLPSGAPRPGTQCYITGWGKTRHPGSMSSVLQQAVLPVVSNNVCYNHNRRTIPIRVTSAMICGGDGGQSRKSGCQGDSGGPYVCNSGGRFELHGAVSYGSEDCNSRKTYTVFVNVNHFKSWIQGNMARY